MTPEERAEDCIKQWDSLLDSTAQRVTAAGYIAAAIREAVAVERARCRLHLLDAITDWLAAPVLLTLRDVRALMDRAEQRIRDGQLREGQT